MEPFWPTKKVKGTPSSAVDYGRLLSFSFFFPLESGNRNWFSRSRCTATLETKINPAGLRRCLHYYADFIKGLLNFKAAGLVRVIKLKRSRAHWTRFQ
jgi:hypothetical protein